ncbi:hypothetical protein [Desulfosoma caldarium]|uniref:hypothetical protein n=1 Tax=Desulfosoma caldarium TaxID=610254 RepID=UPI001474D8C0|nr:hypothetical protein [Desulfosoma caldarium]
MTKRGVGDLLSAFSVLCEMPSALPTVFIMAEDGPEKEALQKHSGALGLGSRVRQDGWRNNSAPFFPNEPYFRVPLAS